MTAAGKIGGEKRFDAGLGHFLADQAGAHRDGIGVVMDARKTRRQRLGDKRAAAGGIAVGGDRNPSEPKNSYLMYLSLSMRSSTALITASREES